MSTHTPGPWKVAKDHNGDYTDVVSEAEQDKPFKQRRGIAYMGGAALRMSDVIKSREANARLIAAAPAMYEALKELVVMANKANIPLVNSHSVRDMGKLMHAIKQAEQALAQAEGR